MNPVVMPPSETRLPPIRLGGSEIHVKVSPEDSGGQFLTALLKVEPLGGPPLHVHSREDEWFFVLKGELTIQVGSQRITAGPGASVFGPRGIPHTFQNLTGEVVEALLMVTPPDFLSFAQDASHAADPAAFAAVASRYGMELVGPPLA